jgi:S-adenosylmethionine synthetase
LVTAFCGTFWPSVTDQGFTHGALASQDVVEIERSAGYAERLITRSIDRAGRE